MHRFDPKKPAVVERLLRDAAWQASHGNPKGALSIYRRLFLGGYDGKGALDRFRALYAEVHGKDLPHEEVFDFIYAAALWGADGVEGTSGSGSDEKATDNRRLIPRTPCFESSPGPNSI
jgi:hypothetical protein